MNSNTRGSALLQQHKKQDQLDDFYINKIIPTITIQNNIDYIDDNNSSSSSSSSSSSVVVVVVVVVCNYYLKQIYYFEYLEF